ncbi:hypothetical protein HRR83_002009 [Exophiala dermatitidis]|uniref:FAD-binding domain-containing protein n=1 Tax=Exophiala dermatitidis TaxID=5970 RepID=A0AAN6EX49_EXODE
MVRGMLWRTLPKDDGEGGKRLGDILASQPLAAPDDTELKPGNGILNLTQGKLNRLLLREGLKSGRVQVHFDTEFTSMLENTAEGVTVLARDTKTGEKKRCRAKYPVGTDGAHSAVRKGLGLPFPGHTWPERLFATNVMIKNEAVPFPTHFLLDRKHWSVCTPLEDPIVGQTTLWRWAMAKDPEARLSGDELTSDEYIFKLYERTMAGPRPLQVEIKWRTLYNIHQRLAPTMRKRKILLAGDAAHICKPIGALGLNTGILDIEAFAEALIMILKEGRSDAVLDVYNDERRKVFQNFVDPISTQNKLRLQYQPPEMAAEDDWYLRIMANPHPTKEQVMGLMKPYFEDWRTDMRKAAQRVV